MSSQTYSQIRHEYRKKIKKYCYERTSNHEYWRQYLGRQLTDEEVSIIESAKDEKRCNNSVSVIHQCAQSHGWYIPMLTEFDGNCFFESLRYHNICDNIKNFRYGLSVLMMMFSDRPNFIPGQELTLKQMFQNTNEIEYVYCRQHNEVYKYNYDVMCIDLAINCSWSRLNTEMILIVLSHVLNLKFLILHENNHVSEICIHNNENTKNVYLALLSEVHYLPLDLKTGTGDPDEEICPKYRDAHNIFHDWASNMAYSLGRVIFDDDNDDDRSCDKFNDDGDNSDNNDRNEKTPDIFDVDKFKPINDKDVTSDDIVEFE